MGLEPALRWFADGYRRRGGVQVDLAIPSGLGGLPDTVQLALFRVAQEALTNIHRHSGSETARIIVLRDGNEVSLEVADEGRGIEPDHEPGLGLLGMRERVAQLGGRLDIASGPQGTTVKAVLPLSKESR